MAKPFAKLVSKLTPKRRWFQFRLRTLFVLVAVAAVPCACLNGKINQKRREPEAISATAELGGCVLYYDQFEKDDFRYYSRRNPPGP
jgi:hypothetical protein